MRKDACGLSHDGAPEPDGHRLSPYGRGNHDGVCGSGGLVDMYVSW